MKKMTARKAAKRKAALADLRERWAEYQEMRTELRELSEQAANGLVSYSEYDEASFDLWEIGASLAEDMADLLGL